MTTRSNRPAIKPRRRSRRIFACGALSLFVFTFVSAANPSPPAVPSAAAGENPIVLTQATTPVNANGASRQATTITSQTSVTAPAVHSSTRPGRRRPVAIGYIVSAKLTTPSPRSTFFSNLPEAFRGSLSSVISR